MLRRGKQVVVAVLGSVLILLKGICCFSPSCSSELSWDGCHLPRRDLPPPGHSSSLLVFLFCGVYSDWSTYSVVRAPAITSGTVHCSQLPSLAKCPL